MKITLKNNIHWVGKIDWELKKFHGDEYSTHRGTTYNAYLVREEKNVLIDTVWKPYAEEFVQNLQKEIDLDSISFIIANHAEIDHSGALPELMRHIPETPVYCTENGIKSLRGHYHQDWNFVPVKTGDTLDIGNGKQLVFVEMKMLHWPDSMACYLTGDHVLFSNDAFGQHYASEHMFNDRVDQKELYEECMKYYANILTPFSVLVSKKIHEVLQLNLPIDMIATSHGIIWRGRPEQIVEKYLEWSNAYQENRITLIYDTMWEGTRRMADAIAKGIHHSDPETVIKVHHAAKTDKNDMITDIFRSKAILLGSPTINRGILTSMAGLLEEVRGLSFKGKKAAAFGCYGWSGESVQFLTEKLKDAGFETVNEGLRLLWNPDEKGIYNAYAFGQSFVNALKEYK